MALQGTLKDFGFADVLQLVGIQRKTGILTLHNGGERVEIRFVEGSLVGAETDGRSLDSRLGQVLVRTGKITEAQLGEALKVQGRTLQRLGHILVKHGHVSEAELAEGLRVQSLQIIFRLFRWREGTYDVRLLDEVDYDREHFAPIGAETILMEGARMVDEWPIIERRVRSDSTVFEHTAAGAALQLEAASLVEVEVDFRPAFGGGEPGANGDARPALQLTPEEQKVLALVDGESSVGEVAERSDLGEFETYRILGELATRDLVRAVDRATVAAVPSGMARLGERAARGLIALLLSLAAVGSLVTLHANPATPWAGGGGAADRLRLYVSRARLEQIERALQVCYLDSGAFPARLEQLAAAGYLGADGLLDPWGRPYAYSLSPGGYELRGVDRAGMPAPELRLSRRFGAAQRMVLGDVAPAE